MCKVSAILFLTILASTAASAKVERSPKRSFHEIGNILLIPDQKHGSELMFRAEIATLNHFARQYPRDLKCLFLEVDTGFNPAIQEFIRNKKSYQNSVGRAISAYVKKWGFQYTNLMPAELLTAAAANQYQVFGVDSLDGTTLGTLVVGIMGQVALYDARHLDYSAQLTQKLAKLAIEARSATIASQVTETYVGHRCDLAVMVIGAAHTKDWIGSVPVIPIQSRLLQQGFTTLIQNTTVP